MKKNTTIRNYDREWLEDRVINQRINRQQVAEDFGHHHERELRFDSFENRLNMEQAFEQLCDMAIN